MIISFSWKLSAGDIKHSPGVQLSRVMWNISPSSNFSFSFEREGVINFFPGVTTVSA